MTSDELREAFFKRVAPLDESLCWIWKGALGRKGYGRYSVYRGSVRQLNIAAHRLSYMLHIGDIPKGMIVMHTCDVPACVNPAHLRLGTVNDNNQDAIRKGRNKGPNRDKEFCFHGHRFDQANTRIAPDGSRVCRECHKRTNRQNRQRKKAVHQAEGVQ